MRKVWRIQMFCVIKGHDIFFFKIQVDIGIDPFIWLSTEYSHHGGLVGLSVRRTSDILFRDKRGIKNILYR